MADLDVDGLAIPGDRLQMLHLILHTVQPMVPLPHLAIKLLEGLAAFLPLGQPSLQGQVHALPVLAHVVQDVRNVGGVVQTGFLQQLLAQGLDVFILRLAVFNLLLVVLVKRL